jgi:hypothetical protein
MFYRWHILGEEMISHKRWRLTSAPHPLLKLRKQKILLCTKCELSGIVGPEASTAFLQLGEIMTGAGAVESPRGVVTQQDKDIIWMDNPLGLLFVGESQGEVVCPESLGGDSVGHGEEVRPSGATENLVENAGMAVESVVPKSHGSDVARSSQTVPLETKVPISTCCRGERKANWD